MTSATLGESVAKRPVLSYESAGVMSPRLPWVLDLCLIAAAAVAFGVGAGLAALATQRVAGDGALAAAAPVFLFGGPGLLLVISGISVLPQRRRAWKIAAVCSCWAAAVLFVPASLCAAAYAYAIWNRAEADLGVIMVAILVGVPAGCGFVAASCEYLLIGLPAVRRAYQMEVPQHWFRGMVATFALCAAAFTVVGGAGVAAFAYLF